MNTKPKIWLLKMPPSLYTQDVKKLARDANIRIIDIKFKANYGECELVIDAPKVTTFDEAAKAEAKKKAPKKPTIKKDEDK